jgi:hypothetical protein
MMKWIFGLLILVNLLFFAVMHWGSALLVDATPPTQAPLNADKIKIVAILPTSAPLPASAVAAASAVLATPPASQAASAVAIPPITVPPPVKLSCMEWGEFAGMDLGKAEKSLAELNLGDKLKHRTIEALSGYWVYIPPMKNQAQIKKKVEQLKKFEVEEYFVMKEAGPWKNSISLGLFKTEDSAKKYLTLLREKGVRSAKIGPRANKLKFTVFELSRLDSVTASKISNLRKDFPDSETKQVACN